MGAHRVQEVASDLLELGCATRGVWWYVYVYEVCGVYLFVH